MAQRARSLPQDDAMRYLMEVYTDERAQQQRLEEDVRQGLTARQKSLPPKYFYDRAGSILFERITELPEYYPTRTESTLLGEIVPGLFRDFFPDEIVEIGSGSSEKTRRILDAVSAGGRTVRYVPLDVDRQTIESNAAAARIEMHLVADSAQHVKLGRLGLTIRFRPGEGIWTESSYKFTRESVESMLATAGLTLSEWHVDPSNYFALVLAAPA